LLAYIYVEFSEALEELGGCFLAKTALNGDDDDDSGKQLSTHANLWCKTYAIYATKEASFSKRNVLISCLGNMKCSAFLKIIYICAVIICLVCR
jgi:hypothetical protein